MYSAFQADSARTEFAVLNNTKQGSSRPRFHLDYHDSRHTLMKAMARLTLTIKPFTELCGMIYSFNPAKKIALCMRIEVKRICSMPHPADNAQHSTKLALCRNMKSGLNKIM